MTIAMWVITGILAAVNLLAGAGKATTPWPKLQKRMPGIGKAPVYLAAWSEITGAIGVIVPLLLARTLRGWDWVVWVAVVAALGLTVVQMLAAGLHIRRKEPRVLPVNFAFAALGIASATLITLNR